MLKAVRGDMEFFYPLVEAGSNRHQINKELRILMEGEPVLEIWIQEPGSKEARIESMELSGLADLQQGRHRLSLHMFCGEKGKVFLRVQDLGLDLARPSEGQEWEFEV